MGKNYYIGTYAGIPVKIHWSLGLLFLFLLYFGHQIIKLEFIPLFWFLLLVVSLFLSVVLHEYGHALVARKYGVKTRDIILSPIGGIARLENIPRQPLQEIAVAIAGPMVNLAIAGLSLLILFVTDGNLDPIDKGYPVNFSQFVEYLFWLNMVLFGFNLIPAFPMDGGRILRGLLSLKLPHLRATKIASTLGKILALCMILIALFKIQPILLAVGIAILYMASTESKKVIVQESLKSTLVDSIFRSRYTPIQETDTMSKPYHLMKNTKEKNFLVFDPYGIVVGSIPELFTENYSSEEDRTKKVRDCMSGKTGFIQHNSSVMEAYDLLNTEGLSILGVRKEGKLVAVVDRTDVQKFLDSLQ